MTFRRRLLLGFALMTLPVALVAAAAIRSNALERHALDALGVSLGRTRTYAEVETAMFNQGEVLWQALSGHEPNARAEFKTHGEVVDYWFDRWTAELRPDEKGLADGVRVIQKHFQEVGDSVFTLMDKHRNAEAYELARQELKFKLQPALTEVNHEIYRRAREYSLHTAFTRVQEIVDGERRALLWILTLTLVLGPLAAWMISRSLVQPLTELQGAMAAAGSGGMERPVGVEARDEIGDLARAFAGMTDRLSRSRADLESLNTQLEARLTDLQQAQARLVQSEKLASIGEMAAGVAHGLRNPLASLRASAQLVLRHPESPAAGEQLRSMIDEVDRLDRRITHLLAFSSPAPVHPLRERPGVLVHSLLNSLAQLLTERRVKLEIDLPDGVAEIAVDPVRLDQAITEIVANSLGAMPGGGTLRVSVGEVELPGGGGEVVIAIADSGPGIPESVMQSVFDPFFTTRPDGTGLGLTMARRFVEQNGGRLELSSRPGQGTTARLYFPAATAPEAEPLESRTA
ncbi:MAG TPA: ATP-binding protein [Gemmatimonadales bacterium]|nr:ATP-binding protein [Gemmatimonadales bacterium]